MIIDNHQNSNIKRLNKFFISKMKARHVVVSLLAADRQTWLLFEDHEY